MSLIDPKPLSTARPGAGDRPPAVWRVLVALAFLGLGCGDDVPAQTATPEAPAGPRPNVVVVVLDTVRPDHLSLHGYGRKTSPKLEALARESTVFDNAFSTSNWTAPSHASLFTGAVPTTHGLTRLHRRFDTPLPTLAEVMSKEGYETVAVAANAVLMKQALYDRGFAQYIEPWQRHQLKLRGTQQLSPERQLDLWNDLGTLDRNGLEWIQGWLAERSREQPFFLFVNLIGAHTPYLSAGPFQDAFDPARTRTDEQKDLLWRYGKSFNWYTRYYMGRESIAEEDLDFLVRHYDAELLYVDHQVGTLMRLLRDHDDWDDTLFIVTSDHGEAHGENDILGHELVLHDVLTRIPMLVRYPARFAEGVRNSNPVQIHDIFPTVLDVAGIPLDRYPSQGVSLASQHLDPERPIFSEVEVSTDIVKSMKNMLRDADDERRLAFFERSSRSLICGDFKYIWASNGMHEFYQRSSDPGEEKNLIDDPTYSEVRSDCSAKLDALVAQYRSQRPVSNVRKAEPTLNETHKAALRALGYIE